jgi:alkanesulfonate monooxygenase SsuD/methylene tetrahydromethanopterin reductase-like flavin-dependent oxidoreductase (luciferase family)
MCRIAGEVGDGLHVHSFHSARYLRECVHPAVQEGLARSGRSRADFTFRASTMAVRGDTEEERRRNARAVKQQNVPISARGPRARGPAFPRRSPVAHRAVRSLERA